MGRMWDEIVERMVARAMPPDLDPEQERIAAEAAENGIRHTLRVAVLLGILLVVAIGAALYRYGYSPDQSNNHRPADLSKVAGQLGAKNTASSEVEVPVAPVSPVSADQHADQTTPPPQPEVPGSASRLGGEDTHIRQGNEALQKENEALQRKLNAMTQSQQSLQAKVTAMEGQLANLAKQPQAATDQATPEVASPSPAAASRAARDKGRVTPKSRSGYTCGDGRNVQDPAHCRGVRAAPEAPAAKAGTYECGNGRTARDPAECKAAGNMRGPYS